MGNARRLSEMPATEVYYDPEHRQVCIRQEDPMRDEAEVVYFPPPVIPQIIRWLEEAAREAAVEDVTQGSQ
jgi:hypothetical protein